MDDELKQYLDRLRQENMKAHLETWRQIAALERRLDALADDNAAAHAETRLHFDATIERDRHFDLFEPEHNAPATLSPAEVHFRRDG